MDEFPRPLATVDVALFALIEGVLCLLVPRRAKAPYEGSRALPGGFVHVDEDFDTADTARRVAREKLGVDVAYLEQLFTFSGRLRDPRGWSISVGYIGLVSAVDLAPDVLADLVPVDRLPPLPFDHDAIATTAIRRLRDKSTYSSLPAFLLPREFTLHDLRTLYERITGERIDKANFRRQIVDAQKLVEPTGVRRTGSAHRPAELFRLTEPGALIFRSTVVPVRRHDGASD